MLSTTFLQYFVKSFSIPMILSKVYIRDPDNSFKRNSFVSMVEMVLDSPPAGFNEWYMLPKIFERLLRKVIATLSASFMKVGIHSGQSNFHSAS